MADYLYTPGNFEHGAMAELARLRVALSAYVDRKPSQSLTKYLTVPV